MCSFAVASDLRSSGSTAHPYAFTPFSIREMTSHLPLVPPNRYCDHDRASACLGREAHCTRTVLLAGPPPRNIQISQRWLFLVSPGLPPQPRRLPRAEGTGFQRARRRRTAAARLRGQGGAWVVGVPLRPLLEADWPSLLRSLHSGTTKRSPETLGKFAYRTIDLSADSW